MHVDKPKDFAYMWSEAWEGNVPQNFKCAGS